MKIEKYFCVDLRTCALVIAGIELVSCVLIFFTVGILFSCESNEMNRNINMQKTCKKICPKSSIC